MNAQRPRSAVPIQGAFAPPSSSSPVMESLLGSAGAQVAQPAAAVEPAEAAVEVRPQAAPPAKRRRTTTRKAATTQRAASEVVVPEPPRGAYPDLVSLNVRIKTGQHWQLKTLTFLRGEKMTTVVGALIEAFIAGPDDWLALIEEAEATQRPIGDLLTPLVREALEQLQDE